MYRLLIVEDEKWEREGLRDFLNWSSLGIEVAGCACNGAEGLKMAELCRPEIIITDIMMPKMNGIQMSEGVRAFLPDTKIIILSGYDDFQYARQSFGFHAFAYLLKPIGKKSFEEVILKALKVLGQEKSRSGEMELLEKQWMDFVDSSGNQLLLDLLEGKTKTKYIQELAPVSGLNLYGKKAIAVMSLFYIPEKSGCGKTDGSLSPEVMNGFCDILRKNGVVFSVSKPLKEAVICIDAPTSQSKLEEDLLSLMDELRKELKVEAVVGVGEAADDYSGMSKSYAQAKEACSFRFLAEYGEIIPYGRINGSGLGKPKGPESLLMKTNSITREIAYSVQKGDIGKSAFSLDAFLSELRENPATGRMLLAGFFSEILSFMDIPVSVEISEDANGMVWNKKSFAMDIAGLDSLSQTRQYLYSFLSNIVAHVKAKGNCDEFEVVRKVIGIIEARYSEDLNLRLLSQEIHLSPYYIGSIFKRFTGKLFNQYLNDYRIDMAKEVLQSKKVKVNHLGEAVGIRNASYFCALFRSRFGISPGEYREVLKGRWTRV